MKTMDENVNNMKLTQPMLIFSLSLGPPFVHLYLLLKNDTFLCTQYKQTLFLPYLYYVW